MVFARAQSVLLSSAVAGVCSGMYLGALNQKDGGAAEHYFIVSNGFFKHDSDGKLLKTKLGGHSFLCDQHLVVSKIEESSIYTQGKGDWLPMTGDWFPEQVPGFGEPNTVYKNNNLKSFMVLTNIGGTVQACYPDMVVKASNIEAGPSCSTKGLIFTKSDCPAECILANEHGCDVKTECFKDRRCVPREAFWGDEEEHSFEPNFSVQGLFHYRQTECLSVDKRNSTLKVEPCCDSPEECPEQTFFFVDANGRPTIPVMV